MITQTKNRNTQPRQGFVSVSILSETKFQDLKIGSWFTWKTGLKLMVKVNEYSYLPIGSAGSPLRSEADEIVNPVIVHVNQIFVRSSRTNP